MHRIIFSFPFFLLIQTIVQFLIYATLQVYYTDQTMNWWVNWTNSKCKKMFKILL